MKIIKKSNHLRLNVRLAFGAALGISLCACNTAPKKESHPELEALRADLASLRTALSKNEARMEAFDGQVLTLTDRIQSLQSQVEKKDQVNAPNKAAVVPHPAEKMGAVPDRQPSPHDPELGFVNDASIQAFRKALILRQSGKLPESLLAFTAFVEQYPDHPMAGQAQFFAGDAYFQQKEYKLAIKELERVLTSYDRSPKVPDALQELAQCYEALHQTDQANKKKQLLTSLYPQSPAAQNTAHTSEPEITTAEDPKP
jgi:tol-pal system protein YbgF